jgi:sodium/hydrogen exchanger-like protein 6/7/sodium/hydrogen exchanger 8
MSETSFGIVSLTIIIILSIYAIAGSFFEHKKVSIVLIKIHIIHETGLGIILGILAGGIFTLIYKGTLYYIVNLSFYVSMILMNLSFFTYCCLS